MAKQLTRSAVRIYGALSALGNDTGSVLEGLLPFLDPILRQHNGAKLSPEVVAASVRSTYRWNFNSDLVEAFVPHLARHNWIVADIPGARDTTYTIQMPALGTPDAATLSIESALRDIAGQFKAFSEALSPLTALPREVEEFEDILVEWLLYVEAFSEDSVKFTSGFRPDEFGKLRQIVDIPNITSLRDDERFLCARFVKSAIEGNEQSAEVLARIASIGLLTEVVQDFVKPVGSIERTDLVVYLDAPVAMELLGLSGKSARENTAPVIEELTRIGASVRIFGQSIEEMQNSLGAVLKNPRPTGPTAQAMMRHEVLREYVIDVSHDPEPHLQAVGVKVTHRTLEQYPGEHQYFTDENRQELYGRLRYAENHYAREHDTSITTFVMRQRRGRRSRDLFKSNAIILTRNGLLAQIVRELHNEISAQSDRSVPPVVHRRVLATAMWLRTGMGAGNLNIPKRMLLATCEHVLAIRPGVVESVRRLTEALGDEDKTRQLDILVSQDRSARVLMDKTLGVANVVTTENLPLLWNEMLHPHLEEERLRGVVAVSNAEAEGKKRLEKANKKLEALRKQSEREAINYAAQIEDAKNEDRTVINALCAEVARTLRRKRRIRIGGGIILGLIFSAPLLMETTVIVRLISFIIGWLLAFLTATGGKMFTVSTDENSALKSLTQAAERRGLLSKLRHFDLGWSEDSFVIRDRPSPPQASGRDDLFT